MFTTVGIQFNYKTSFGEKDKEYAYLTDLMSLKVGDLVVVDTQYGYKTAKVSSLFCNEYEAHKWIVCKIDINAFEAKLEDLKKKQFIFKQMKQRLERVNTLALFESASKNDPEMAKLLQEFNTPPKGKIVYEQD